MPPQVCPVTFVSEKRPRIHKQFTIPMVLPYPVRAGLLWAFERGILDRVCGPEINRLRAELGLKPVKRVMGRWMHSPQGVLGLFPEWFAPPQSDWPSSVKLTGFPLFDDAGSHRLDAELEKFLEKGGGPPIVFTPGSTLINESAYRDAATAALDALGCRGIFLGGQGAELPKGKSTVITRAYVPLSQLLPRARALVHQRGIGRASQAFAAGIPQLITPFAHDQFDNDARVERLGCGLQLGKAEGAHNFLAPLRRLLEDDMVRQSCSEIRSRVESGEASRRKALQALEHIALGVPNPSHRDLSWQPR